MSQLNTNEFDNGFIETDELNSVETLTAVDTSVSKENGNELLINECLDLDEIRSFVMKPCPKGVTVQCKIQRCKSGIKNRMYPTYQLFLSKSMNQSKNEKFLLAARKRPKNKTSNYIISTSQSKIDRNDHLTYVGKLRSNFVGTEFVFFDNGINPKNASPKDQAIVRKELGAIFFQSNIFGSRGPRRMSVLVPSFLTENEDADESATWKPKLEKESMLSRYKSGDLASMHVLKNREPKWNEQVGAYVLNFNGRVTMASVKNFQLVKENSDDVLLQFGRVGKDVFTMDVLYPLTVFQAFCVCLSSFDYKIACE